MVADSRPIIMTAKEAAKYTTRHKASLYCLIRHVGFLTYMMGEYGDCRRMKSKSGLPRISANKKSRG